MPKKNYHQGFQYQLGGEYTPIKHTPLNQEGYSHLANRGAYLVNLHQLCLKKINLFPV